MWYNHRRQETLAYCLTICRPMLMLYVAQNYELETYWMFWLDEQIFEHKTLPMKWSDETRSNQDLKRTDALANIDNPSTHYWKWILKAREGTQSTFETLMSVRQKYFVRSFNGGKYRTNGVGVGLDLNGLAEPLDLMVIQGEEVKKISIAASGSLK